jgi:RNA polymerase sigma-70 factor (ECF subfamily)
VLRYPVPDPAMHLVEVNGGPGIVSTSAGTPIAALVLDVADGLVQRLQLVGNPEKLTGLRGLVTDG